ncbi:MAG: hypothetical protein AAFR11_01445 [Pseudomonadota bacterium]
MKIAVVALRVLGFAALQAAVFMTAGGALFAGAQASDPPTDPGAALAALAGLCLGQGLAATAYVARGPLDRTARMAAVFAVAFGAGTIVTQIDTAYYLPEVGAGFLARVVALGAITSVSAAILAGLLFRTEPTLAAGRRPPAPGPAGRAVRWSIFSLGHMAAYFVLGYWIVWVRPEARAYYDGAKLEPFLQHMAGLAGDSPEIFLVQFVRGLVWAGIAELIFRTTRRSTRGAAVVATALFIAFSVLQLFMPNALMPAEIRMLHVVETGLTMVVLAALGAALFGRRRAA